MDPTGTSTGTGADADADVRRLIPRTDAVLRDPRLLRAAHRLGAARVKSAVRRAQQRAREGSLPPDEVADAAVSLLPGSAGGLRPVINATGVLLHTDRKSVV